MVVLQQIPVYSRHGNLESNFKVLGVVHKIDQGNKEVGLDIGSCVSPLLSKALLSGANEALGSLNGDCQFC